jgi:hypothetical protein
MTSGMPRTLPTIGQKVLFVMGVLKLTVLIPPISYTALKVLPVAAANVGPDDRPVVIHAIADGTVVNVTVEANDVKL